MISPIFTVTLTEEVLLISPSKKHFCFQLYVYGSVYGICTRVWVPFRGQKRIWVPVAVFTADRDTVF